MQILEYGPSITLAQAKEIAAAAEAEALANQWPMVIAIADSCARLVLLHKMDQAQFGSIEVAQAKANTAVSFKRATKVFEDAVAEGGIGLRALSVSGICALNGGFPIIRNGKLIGAIGVSGAAATEDAQVAQAGLKALAP